MLPLSSGILVVCTNFLAYFDGVRGGKDAPRTREDALGSTRDAHGLTVENQNIFQPGQNRLF